MAQQTFEEIVAAVKQAESRGKRYAADGKTLTTSPKGALGEMQVMPKTITDPGFGVVPAKDKSPDEIARVGVDYLQAMKQRYGDTEKALIAYNWGPGSTDKWIAAGADPKKLPAETRTYVERVKGFLGGNVPRETSVAKKEREPLPPSLPPMAEAQPTPAKATMAKVDIKGMPASYQAAFALAALADAQDEEDDRVYNENKSTETEEFFANYKPVNKLASLDLSVTPVMMKDGGDVTEAKETARKGEAYQELEKYLESRGEMPSVKIGGYMPGGTNGIFTSDNLNIGSGTIKINKDTAKALVPSVLAHEVTHAADRQLRQQAIEQGMFGNSNQFTEAYEKMVGPEGRNRTLLLRKRYPEFELDNRYYRSEPKEVAAHGIGAYAGPNIQDRAPRHVDATAATEFRILMDLAQRNVDKGPTGLAKIPAFFRKFGRYADGGEVEQERLTPQQIERIAAQESAEREAASNAAFIAQKSGIGRKAGPVSQALQSGQGQIEFLKGMTNVPQNILGAPVDLATMAMRPFGYDVEKPFMGSEYLKEKSRAAGLGFTPSTDPTLAGFYGAGDLGSNLVNPAGVTRTGVKAAEKTGEAAKMLARDFQGYNQQLAVPGASYAVRNKGTPVAMSGLPFLSNVDEAEFLVKGVIGSGKKPLELTDKSLSDWFSKTVTRYLRSDFATPQDQLVRAAEENKMLHLAPKEFSDSAEDQALKHFLGRRQSDLEYMRQAEGFGKSNMATTPYGQRIEDITDISAYPERVGDLTPQRVPASMRNLVDTQPEARVTDFAPNIVENLKLEQLRDKMLDVRQSDGKYGAYGQPAVKIPSEFLLPDDTLAKLNVAAASNRMARYTKWQDETRQKMATTALRADPAFPRAELQEGKFLGVALPDIKKNPDAKQLVIDVGCDGGWCTRYTPNAETYASGFSRLHVIVTGEGKQARPVAQFAIADNGSSYDTKRFSIIEIKEKGNTADFANNPALPAIQEYIQFLDKTYRGLDYVDNLKGLRMTQLPEYPMQLLDLFNPTVQQRRMLENKYGSEENGFRAVRDKAVDLNNGSRFMTGNEDAVANSLEQAMQLLVGPKETLARRIQMNLFGLPKEKATGGMIERQPNDNRRYL